MNEHQFKVLLATYYVMKDNLFNFRYNIKGKDYFNTEPLLKGLYYEISQHMETISMIIVDMKGDVRVGSQSVEDSMIPELDKINDCKEIIKLVDSMLKTIVQFIEEMMEYTPASVSERAYENSLISLMKSHRQTLAKTQAFLS